jgi:LPS-assembly protein
MKSFFSYTLTVLTILGTNNAFASNIKSSSTITADKLETNIEDNSISAKGNVELINEGKKFYADELKYYKSRSEIEAIGRIKLNDEENNSFFAHEVTVSDDINTGEFYDAGLIFDNGSFVISPQITRENKNIFRLKKPTYGICPSKLNFDQSYEEIVEQTFNKKQFLSIHASNVKINREKQGIYFYNAVAKVYGVPIFYFPYLKTRHPAFEETTGIKIPKLRHSSNYGYGVLFPYFIRISDTQNMTIAPLFYQERNSVLGLEYNKSFKGKEDNFSFEGDITDDHKASNDFTDDEGDPRTRTQKGFDDRWRGYGATKGAFNMGEKWNTYFNGKFVSDTKYLKDYYSNYTGHLQSNLNFERLAKNNILTLDTIHYREFDESRNSTTEDTPNFVPMLNHSFRTGFFSNNTNFTTLYRESGLNYRRLSVDPTFELPQKFFGSLFIFKTHLRTDVYSLDGERVNDYDSFENRFTPQAQLDWSMPFIKNYKKSSLIFEPVANVITSPNGDSDKDRIPNEDSLASELNDVNLFSTNRYSGYDRVEYGTRINYGLRSNYFHETVGDFGFFLGQGYRQNDEENTDIRGFTENVSDYVGMFSYSIDNHFDLYYRFRSDRTNWDEKNTEVTADLTLDRFSVNVNYTKYQPEQIGDLKHKELRTGTTINLTRDLQLILSNTRDLLENQNIRKTYKLKYDGSCIEYSFSVVENRPINQKKTDRVVDFSLNIKANIF